MLNFYEFMSTENGFIFHLSKPCIAYFKYHSKKCYAPKNTTEICPEFSFILYYLSYHITQIKKIVFDTTIKF